MRLIVTLYEAEAIRAYIEPVATLLRSATEHPSMLVYLDQARSQLRPRNHGRHAAQQRAVPGDLGRELLELPTLGAGSGYAQADDRSATMVLTGLSDRPAGDGDDFSS